MDLADLLNALKFWVGYEQELESLGLYAVGLALYALLVWSMCVVISRRDLLSDGDAEPKPGAWAAIGRIATWLFLFPTVATGYFLMIAVALFFLAKNQTGSQILLVAVSLVAGIRICAWLSPPTAREVAKIVPIGLLGVLIVEPGYLSFEATMERFRDLPGAAPVLGRYLLAMFLLELAAKPLIAFAEARERRKAAARKTRRVPLTPSPEAPPKRPA